MLLSAVNSGCRNPEVKACNELWENVDSSRGSEQGGRRHSAGLRAEVQTCPARCTAMSTGHGRDAGDPGASGRGTGAHEQMQVRVEWGQAAVLAKSRLGLQGLGDRGHRPQTSPNPPVQGRYRSTGPAALSTPLRVLACEQVLHNSFTIIL